MPSKYAWVVLHCEVFLRPRGESIIDECPFYAASSEAKALELIRGVHVDSGTWWRIHCVPFEHFDEAGRPYWRLYSRAGKRIATSPDKMGYRAALKRNRELIRRLPEWIAKAKAEGDRRSVQNLRLSLNSVKRLLRDHS